MTTWRATHPIDAPVILWAVFGLTGGATSVWALVYRRVWIVHLCLAVLTGAVLGVRTHRRWSAGGAWGVLLISLLTVAEFVFGVQLPIDQPYPGDVLWVDHWFWPPGRMSVMSALILPWLALAVVVWHVRWRWIWWVLVEIAAMLLYGALITHVYQALGTSVYVPYVNMGRSTLLVFVGLLAGMLAQRLTRPTRRAKVWRRLLVDARWWNVRVGRRSLLLFRADDGQSFVVGCQDVMGGGYRVGELIAAEHLTAYLHLRLRPHLERVTPALK